MSKNHIHIGGMAEFDAWPTGQALVSATKTVHRTLVTAEPDSPHYLHYQPTPTWLALNMIDGAAPWDALVDTAVRWIHTAPRPLLIHCNHGKSRSPTIFIAYQLALGVPLDEAHDAARQVNPRVDIHPKLWQYLTVNQTRLKGLLQ